MPSLEIHPLSALRDEPAELLAKRYARQRAAESYSGMELPSIEEHEEGWNDLWDDADELWSFVADRDGSTEWRSVNLLSSRFWPRRGFRPQYLRLYRAVP